MPNVVYKGDYGVPIVIPVNTSEDLSGASVRVKYQSTVTEGFWPAQILEGNKIVFSFTESDDIAPGRYLLWGELAEPGKVRHTDPARLYVKDVPDV